jgi:hypothetical protein
LDWTPEVKDFILLIIYKNIHFIKEIEIGIYGELKRVIHHGWADLSCVINNQKINEIPLLSYSLRGTALVKILSKLSG